MKPDDPRHPWARLTAAARKAPPEPAEIPFGFATRVAALGLSPAAREPSLYERFAPRAAAIAALLGLASMALNLPVLEAEPAPPMVIEDYDPVAVLLGEEP